MDVMKMRQTGAFILPTLLPRIKRTIDVYLGVPKSAATFGKRWPSCAVVRTERLSPLPCECSALPRVGSARQALLSGISPYLTECSPSPRWVADTR